MLYKYNKTNKNLEELGFCDITDLDGREKDLEDLCAQNLWKMYAEDNLLMPILQEISYQEECDMGALNRNGDLVIFELKRCVSKEDATMQIMKYLQIYGQKNYRELNDIYLKYRESKKGSWQDEIHKNCKGELKTEHREFFQLEEELQEWQFNRRQKLIVVGNSSDDALINNIEFWKGKGIDIDFLPYRFYTIHGEIYFEFFAKPYDYHLNPQNRKGIMFDTDRNNNPDALWDMIKNKKVSAYGAARRFIKRFNKNDYAFFYHAGWGIVGAGRIASKQIVDIKEKKERYLKVDLLTPSIEKESDIRYLSPKEIKGILKKDFWWASTVKSPYLSKNESEELLEALKAKYSE